MFKNNLCYEASAGSGKTFMLVVRYLSLLFNGADPSKILALTFTNKAASEMSERVVQTLEELEFRGELEEIIKVTGASREEILAQRKRVLALFLNANTKIMTIDSFFTQVLRKFSLYASLMPDFSTFSSQHELKLLSRFLKEVSVANKRSTLINLSLVSKKRITDIFALLDEFYVKKEELSTLEFRANYESSYKERAMVALEAIATLVSECKGASATLKSAVLANDFEELLTKTWILKDSLNYWVFKKCFDAAMDRHLQSIKEAVLEHYRAKEQNFFAALSELVGIYKKSKKALYMEDGELSFNDVTSLVYEILHLIKDSDFLYFRLDATIEHMLLDEFQDTSILQYEILRPLISEITSGEGVFDEGSFFFVGDVKQSIYRFRGGVSALFHEVAAQNGTEIDKLLTNYRSRQEVVAFVNSVFENRIKNYTPQLVREGAEGGYVEIIKSQTPLDEAIEQVKRLLYLGADPNEIALLCATNGDGEELKLALMQEKIEVVTETTTKLINQKSVKALLEYLKYLYFKEEIYRLNFFALLQRKAEPIRMINFSSSSLVDIVKRAIEEYKLFHDEFHLIRFLGEISRFGDIEALLFEYERLDTSAAASDLSGVRVLTIHKSKGLEYEHVILMDRLKGAPAPRNSIIYEYEGIRLQNIYLRTKNRDALDMAYKRALQKEQELLSEDKLNSLYVAFTRARDNLFIIAKEEKSDFDLLDLHEGHSGTLHCKESVLDEKVAFERFDYKELYYGTQSEILELEKEESLDLEALHFGTALHYALEMLGSFDLSSIESAKDMMLNKYGFLLSEDEVGDILSRLEMLVQNREFLALTQGECFKEKALRYKNSLRYIDLLVKNEDSNYIVIDYKSSRSHQEEHKKQVKSYINAIEAITHRSTQGYLCYLLKDSIKIVRVS